VTRKQKRRFQTDVFQACLGYLHCYLTAISNMHRSSAIRDRKNASVLMAYTFKHEIAKIIKIAFDFVI
jgi:hypothetical protein